MLLSKVTFHQTFSLRATVYTFKTCVPYFNYYLMQFLVYLPCRLFSTLGSSKEIWDWAFTSRFLLSQLVCSREEAAMFPTASNIFWVISWKANRQWKKRNPYKQIICNGGKKQQLFLPLHTRLLFFCELQYWLRETVISEVCMVEPTDSLPGLWRQIRVLIY